MVTWFESLIELHSLPEEEQAILQAMPARARVLESGASIHRENAPTDSVYAVHKGWAAAKKGLADGSVQLLDIFVPGQIIGLREIGGENSLATVIAITDLHCTEIQKADLRDFINRCGHIAQPLMQRVAQEEAWLQQRMLTLGQRTAEACLGHFLLEISERLACRTDQHFLISFELPLSQEQIGMAIGMTPVHVSRCLGRLRTDGLLDMRNQRVRFLRLPHLIELCDYKSAPYPVQGQRSIA